MWADKAAAMPYAYEEYVLCTKVFHCTPSELDAQDADRVTILLAIWNGEQAYFKEKRKADEDAARAKK